MNNKILSILFLLAFAITGCKSMDPEVRAQKRRDESLEKLRAITVEDGIDANEARLWAGEYAAKYIPERVTLGFPEDQEHSWAIQPYVGEGTRLPNVIYVHKTTGQIKYSNRPVVDKPWEEFVK